MSEIQNFRLDWIDAAKGIGIILVLIGHCNIPNVNDYIYLFHMPLFYVISGMCWNVEKNKAIPFKEFALKKYRGYIIPYFKIATICFIIFGVGADLIRIGYGSEYLHQLLKYIFGIAIYSRGTTEWLPNCSPIWFLTALFLAEIMFHWITKQSKPIIYVACAGLLGYLCYLCGKVFPWNLDNAFTAIPFLYVGIMIRRYWQTISRWYYLPLSLIASRLIFCFGKLGGDYDGNYLGSIYLRGVESIVIITCLLSICYKGGGGYWLRYTKFLGKNTIILFGYNYAINACLHFTVPSINHSWLMSLIVIVWGTLLVLIANKVEIIKKIII